MNKHIVVAIDGPAGAGKSTVAKMVAQRLSYLYIDTGAMYRAVAYMVMRDDLTVSEPSRITAAAKKMDIKLRDGVNGQKVYVDDEDVTDKIRGAEITRLTPPVSAVPGVRKVLVEQQRHIAQTERGVVMEGRDIGTVVFPDAVVKIFLTASVEERARRRALELQAKGAQVDIAQVETDIRERDLIDSTRVSAPLVQARDAALVNSDGMDIEQVVETIVSIHDEKVSAL